MRDEDLSLLRSIQDMEKDFVEPTDDRFVKPIERKPTFTAPPEPVNLKNGIISEKKEITNPIIQELSPEKKRFNQQMQIATTLSKSTIVPAHFRGKPEDIFACVMLGAELGFQPMMSLSAIVIIAGNTTLKAQTMVAVVRAKCPSAILSIEMDEEKKIAIVKAKRDATDPGYIATWNLDKAKSMGLLGRDQWIKQPMTMLRWRATSEALRMVFADVLMGICSTEEMLDVTEPRRAIATNEAFKD